MRNEYTNEGQVKEFKNGNINIKLSNSARVNLRAGRWSAVEVLSWLLDCIDTYFVGEQFCLSNYDTGAILYNAHADRAYTISFGQDIDNVLMSGETLKLYARIPDSNDRETIKNSGY